MQQVHLPYEWRRRIVAVVLFGEKKDERLLCVIGPGGMDDRNLKGWGLVSAIHGFLKIVLPFQYDLDVLARMHGRHDTLPPGSGTGLFHPTGGGFVANANRHQMFSAEMHVNLYRQGGQQQQKRKGQGRYLLDELLHRVVKLRKIPSVFL